MVAVWPGVVALEMEREIKITAYFRGRTGRTF